MDRFDVAVEGRAKCTIAGAAEQGPAGDLSASDPGPCPWTALHPSVAAPCRRKLLAGTPHAGGSAPPGLWRREAASHPDGLGGLADHEGDKLPRSFRVPPAPYREPGFALGPGSCCICGQPIYRLGWHRDLWSDGKPNVRAKWHACCVAAWKAVDLAQRPRGHLACAPAPALRRHRRASASEQRRSITARPCSRFGATIGKPRGPRSSGFGACRTCQAINRPAHTLKCAAEARDRATRSASSGLSDAAE